MNPKVSVIIPSYNRARLIAESLESVYGQTYENLEVIVVDDGSSDGTEEALAPYIRKGLKFIKHEANRGAPAARNTGIEHASGELIAFLDSDDRWEKDKIALQVEKMRSSTPDTALVYSGIRKIDDKGNLLGFKIPRKRGNVFLDLLKDNCIGSTSTALVRASALKKTGGFDTSLRSRQDLDLWLRIAQEFRVDYVKEPLVVYLVHTDRISSNTGSRIQGYESILKKYRADIEKHPSILSDFYYQLGWLYLKKGEKDAAVSYLKKSLKVFFKPKALYYLIACSAGRNSCRQ